MELKILKATDWQSFAYIESLHTQKKQLKQDHGSVHKLVLPPLPRVFARACLPRALMMTVHTQKENNSHTLPGTYS